MNKMMRFKPKNSPVALEERDLHLWWVNLDKLTINYDWQKCLSFDEVQKAKRFHFESHQALYIKAHVALREILARYLTCSANDIQFREGKWGKPHLSNTKTALHFNLSHSGEKAFIGVSKLCELGVDIEQQKARRVVALARRFFSRDEAKAVSSEEDLRSQQALFFQIWSQKESFIKAVGEGLRYPLEQFVTPIKPKPTDKLCSDLKGRDWYISSDVRDDYFYAWCMKKLGANVKFYEFNQ